MRRIAIIVMGLFLTTASVNEVNAQRRVKKVKVTKVVKVPSTKVVYKKPKRKVVTVRTLPRNKVVVNNRGVRYHYVNNKFYRYYGGRYINVAPRPGLRIKVLPTGFRTVVYAGRNYFWFDGIFYLRAGDQYEVVYPEVGTLVYELPDNAEKVEIDGNLLYESNDVLYEKIQVDGTRAYEVVGIIEE